MKAPNGDGSVYQRQTDKQWIAAIGLPDGRRKTKTCATRREARLALGVLRRARDRGELATSTKDTVDAYLDRWLDSRRGVVRDTSHAAYAVALAHLRPLIGYQKLSALRTSHIQAAYAALGSRATNPLAPRSIRQVHAILHNALSCAVAWEELARNPCAGVELPRVDRSEMRVYDAAQLAQLFAATADDREAALWRLLATTGLRKGEALGLRWSDYDEPRATLAIHRQLRCRPGGGTTDAPLKTRASYRSVAVPGGTALALAAWRTAQKMERWDTVGQGSADPVADWSAQQQQQADAGDGAV